MPAYTVPTATISKDAGYLFYGNLGSSLPTNTVAASVFTDDWSAVPGWFLLGVTREGSEWTYEIETENIESAEYFDPLVIVTVGRAAKAAMDLMRVSMTMLKRVLNGGTLSTSGSGATLLSSYTPPQAGAEQRCMIGWESQDNTERWVFEQALQTGSMTIGRKKGAENASYPVEFSAEIPASGFAFRAYGAGAARG